MILTQIYSDISKTINIRYLYQALNKKENKGGLGSPDGCGGIDSDGEEIGTTTTLTPRTEEKYNRIDVEFQNMMHRNLLNGNRAVSTHEKRFGHNINGRI